MELKQAESSQFVGQHAVVIGASMAGLLTARVLSDRFEHVTLIERDRLVGMEARKGVPQGRQLHVILSKGTAVIAALFHDLFPALLEGGATKLIRLPISAGISLACGKPSFPVASVSIARAAPGWKGISANEWSAEPMCAFSMGMRLSG